MTARRLDGFLCRHGHGSRATARDLIRAGRVTVAGATVRDPAQRVGDAPVAVDGRLIAPLPERIDLLLHKPAGCACSRDPREAPLVHGLLPAMVAALVEPAGRLDRDTTGLLILTSDGTLNHRLTGPRHEIPKRYRVQYAGALPADAVAQCAAGLSIDGGGACLPARLVVDETTAAGGRATLILHEGRHHQVKRMFAALGATIVALHRDRVGALELPADLAPGDCRPLTAGEREQLLQRPPDG
jgi:16S rRNA pseudouridine516 synthase